MIKNKIKGELFINRSIVQRLDKLLSIDDFEEEQELFEELDYDMDSCAFRDSIQIDGYYMEVYVFTGQTNAWIDFIVRTPEGDVYSSEPIFDSICGEYYLNLEGTEVTLNIYS